MLVVSYFSLILISYFNLMFGNRKLALAVASVSLAYTYANCKTEVKHEAVIPKFKTRADHLRQIQKNPTYDVLVIGGGCNGVGVLLDASTRGLRTLLIEKDDFSSGASSKSTKLVHGGLRYLQQVFEFSLASISSRIEKFYLVKQSIQERNAMIDSASHLTSKFPCVIPCKNIFYGVYYYIGSLMYYLIYKWYSPKTTTAFHSPYFLNRTELVQAFPHINPKYSLGVVYEDGSFNDSRLLLAAIFTATLGNGIKMPESFVPANVLNKAEFVDFLKNEQGKIIGGIFKDNLTGKTYKINAKYVVNCTGVWADKIRLLDNPSIKKRICLVAGSHIVYDARLTSGTYGITAPTPDGRIILVQPWLGRVLAGTTQKKFTQPTNNPKCSDQQREFITRTMMDLVSELDIAKFLSYEKSRWCGLRPLVAEDADNVDTKSIARKHVIEQLQSGLLSLLGGKWTIYRRMGQDLVDLIAKKEEQSGRQVPPSQTLGLSLLGSAPQKVKESLYKSKGDVGVQLYNSFGWLANEVAKGNTQRVYGSTSLAELEWIVKNEMATSIQDVLMRRTRLCFLLPKAELLPLVSIVGKLMQKHLNWSDKQTKQQINKSIDNIVSYEFE